MIRRPPGSTRTDTLLPYTTLFRSRRRLRRLALADFDEVAVHAVVADLEGGNASGFALALLELDEEPVGVGRELAQFVEFARSEEHTSELQSLMRISYAVFCLKKKKKTSRNQYTTQNKQTKPT